MAAWPLNVWIIGSCQSTRTMAAIAAGDLGLKWHVQDEGAYSIALIEEEK